MKYKAGDRVKIQSLERYNKYKNRHGDINYGCETEILFTSEMSSFCGQVVTITRVRYIGCVRFYNLAEDKGAHLWVDGMFEGLVEDKAVLNKWTGLKVELELSKTVIGVSNVESLRGERFMSGFVKAIIPPEGYRFTDENGNVINATKIVLEKKKKEYPKTHKECCEILDIIDNKPPWHGYRSVQLKIFQKLIICRDAYWKIAGEEMGLGKPWEPGDNKVFGIIRQHGKIQKYNDFVGGSTIFEFPTEEMRDDFKENFDPDIEICKELL